MPIKFKCDLHPWNFAYVGVFTHPFFGVTDKHGRFGIQGVPPGRCTLEVFHPRIGKIARAVSISNSQTVVDFKVTPK
ncbi:MAG: hypothetical protein EXS31_15040 [Pedosphaera sp.]|nr:hypothetical protein [Pedosphaera sp.]